MNYRAIYSNHQSAASAFQHPGCSEASCWCGKSGDVGNRMIRQRKTGVWRPTRGIDGRTSLGGKRRPQPQVFEDAPDDSRILNQRDHPHRPFALGAFQGISLIDLAYVPRPSGFCASRKFSRRLRARYPAVEAASAWRGGTRWRIEILPPLMQYTHYLNPVSVDTIHDGVWVSADHFVAGPFAYAFGPDQRI